MRRIKEMSEENAYFTVEAAMVFTIVIAVIVLLIYLLFFQYNRCLMEQDVGALALKGCTVSVEDKNTLMLNLKEYADAIYQKKFIAWKQNDIKIALKGGTVRVSRQGTLKYPFSGMDIGNIGRSWTASASYENHRIDPVGFIRMYRRLESDK